MRRHLALLAATQLLLVLLSGCASDAGTADVGADAAYDLVQDGRHVILDVRTPEEYAAGRIEGAVNLDFSTALFRAQLEGLDRSARYLVYCRTGNRSLQAMPIFEELGFVEVYDLIGGIVDWSAHGYPVAR